MDLNPIDMGLVVFVLAAISLGGLFKRMTGLGLPMFAVPALPAGTIQGSTGISAFASQNGCLSRPSTGFCCSRFA